MKIKLPVESLFKTGYNYIEVFYRKNLEFISAYQGSVITNKKTIKSNQISIKAKEGSNILVKISVNNLKANVSSGAKLKLRGVSNEVNLNPFHDKYIVKSKSSHTPKKRFIFKN